MKKILFVAAEAMPFAATGGLGDVIGSLPAAIKASAGDSVDVRVVLPLYRSVSADHRALMKLETEYDLSLSWRKQYCGIYSLRKDNVTYYFVDNEYYFGRDVLYGHFDDAERYAFFCKAAIDLIGALKFYPDVVHAHDWQAALSLVYLNQKYRQIEGYENIKTVFTIHNIEYQGKYDLSILQDVFELGVDSLNILEYNGCINLMKGAIVCADKVSTVSPRYAVEICGDEHSHGLAPLLRDNSNKLCGILNGIDYCYYDPKNDNVIKKTFDSETINDKLLNKSALQQEVGLPIRDDIPLVAVISRLAAHKGLDIVSQMMYTFLNNNDVQFVVLGKGETCYEEFFSGLESAFPDKAKALLTYNRDLSKKIYAAADIFLMPSKSEPCGLSQMIASRYGAIPVTRETGGLYDSIKHIQINGNDIIGNGFTFSDYNSCVLLSKAEEAVRLWKDPTLRERVVKSIMNTDFSWSVSAKSYLDMYDNL